MENWQSKYIRKNLSELIENTDCNALFLSKLNSHLSKDDEAALEATLKLDGRLAEAKLLYDISQTREGMYETLTRGLFEAKQSRAFLVLLNGLIEHRINNVLQICNIDEKDEQLHYILKRFTKASINCHVTFQGHPTPLTKILQSIATDAAEILTENYVKGNFLVDLINNKQPVVIENTVPGPLSYYIPRRLATRNILDPAVFQSSSNDVFVVRGIQPYELRLLTKNQTTDVSGNQMETVTCRFIVLEYENDFEQICKISQAAVHLLHHNEGRLTCVKSSGDISNLHEHIHKDQDRMEEDNFLKLCLESTSAICISDSPGMGKTVLLASLANKIMEIHPNRMVQYFVLREFVPQVEKLRESEIGKEVLIDLICKESSKSELGNEIIRELLKSETQTVELMFDGFDEVLYSQISTAKKILKILAELKSVRLYVTTRPHLREELENTLGTLGYNIMAFGRDEQVSFLTKYWEQHQANSGERLLIFAKECLEALKGSLNDFEQNFAGIPLQCKLLAEVYQDQAVKYSRPESRVTEYDTGLAIRITSIFEMYKKLIDLKMEKTQPCQRKFLICAHMYASLQLLFPEYAPEFQYILIRCFDIEPKEICTLGIIEKTVADDAAPRFIHRTFSEYFLGLFVVKMLDKNSEFHFPFFDRRTFLNFFSNIALCTTSSAVELLGCITNNCKVIQSAKFQYPVICYFINAHMKFLGKSNFEPWAVDYDSFYDTLTACAMQDCLTLYNKAIEPTEHKELIQKNSSRLPELHIISAKYSGLEFFKTIQQQMMECLESTPCYLVSSSPQFIITPLHVAVQRGNYSITEHLLHEHFDLQNLKYVIHCCVANSSNNNDTAILQKLQILQLLTRTYPNWINELLPDDDTSPLLQHKVHIKLLECLIMSGASVNAIDSNGCILHRLVENEFSPQKYQDILLQVLSCDFIQFNATDCKQRTPLHVAIQKIELQLETIELFHMFEANFNAVDEDSDSILFYAIRSERSINLISTLVLLGVNTNHKNANLENVLHMCAKYGNHEAFEYFLNSDKIANIDVVAENCSELSPFMEALENGEGLTTKLIKMMEKKGLQLTSQLASEGLNCIFRNKNLLPSDYNTDFMQVADYLIINKGGILNCRHGKSPWELEATKRNMETIQHTVQWNTKLLKELQMRGVKISDLDEKETKNPQLASNSTQYSESVLALLKKRGIVTKPSVRTTQSTLLLNKLEKCSNNTFERLLVSLLACKQTKPFLLLKQCLQSDTIDSAMFVTLPKGLLDFIESEEYTMVLLKSWDVELTIRRIRDLVDLNLQIVNEADLEKELPISSTLTVYTCETVENSIVQKLLATKRKTIIICSNVSDDLEGFNIVEDEMCWKDISSYFQNHLISINETFSIVNEHSRDFSEIKNEALVELIREYEFELIDVETTSVPEVTFLSKTIFHFFLPDKLVFYGISPGELEQYSKFGQQIGEEIENVDILDYFIIYNEEDFDKICKLTDSPVHLIKCDAGQFELVRSAGINTELLRFIEKPSKADKRESTQVNHPMACDNVLLNVFRFPKKQVSCWVNILDMYPNMSKQDIINFLKNVSKLNSTTEIWKAVTNKLKLQVIKINPMNLEGILGYNETEHNTFKQVAVNTVFPHLVNLSVISGLDKYVKTGVVKAGNNSRVFVNEDMAWYFIAELLSENDAEELDKLNVNIDELSNTIFQECFEHQENQISVIWWDNTKDCSDPFHTFKFVNIQFFKFLNHFVSNSKLRRDVLTKHLGKHVMTDYVRWTHACVRDNLYELLKVITKFGENKKVFETEDILLLALKFADLPVIKLVVKHYAQQSLKKLRDIKLELKWTGDGKEVEIITLLHVAALRGNYSVMQYLLKIHDFEDLVRQQHVCEILCFCVVDTYAKDEEIHERKRIIDDLLNIDPSLIEGVNKLRFTPLLYPNIHFDLVILLIDLGVNVDATNFISNNMLHLFPEYFTPEEYDKVVQHLENSGKTKLFHSLNKRQETPLYRAILYFDLLDSTIDIFARAGFDFNVPIENTTTLLSHAIEEERSASLLDSLVRSGADINTRVGKYNMTPLHKAVSQDNLSALRYLISRGVDVNSVDKDKETPLHLALRLPGKYSFRIVQSLLQHDADINAVDTLNRTPISNAEDSYKNGKISKQTLELLEKRQPKQAQNMKEDIKTLSINQSKKIIIDGTSYKADTLFVGLEKISQVFVENAILSWEECRIVKFNIGHKIDTSSKNSQNLCKDFPSCTCKYEVIMVEFNFKFDKCNHKRLNVVVSIQEVLPVLQDILNLNDSLKLFEVKRLFGQAYHLPYNIDIWKIMEKPNHAQVLSHISQSIYLLGELLTSLGNSESERNQLKHIAVNTLFPNLTRNVDVRGFEHYLKSGVLRDNGKHVVFVNSDLAWCFISELLLEFEKPDCVDLRLNGIITSIFNDCVDCKKLIIWHSIGSAAEEMETFEFKNHTFFNSLEYLLSKQNLNIENSLKNTLNKNLTKDNVDKCVQASVLANLPNLLRILLSTLRETKLFESRHFVGLAVKFSGLQIMELVIEQYIRQTDNQIKDAKLSVSDPYYVIPVLHIAALRGDFSVMLYLLEKHAYKDRLHYSKLDNILHHCVIHTCKLQGNDVIERQRIISLLVKLHPQLILKKDKFNRTPLMVPYANVELIILLINLGVDVSATNNQSRNVLHICAEYLEPQEYDELLRCLSNRGDTKIFHSQDCYQETPLSRAVICLDVLDSSLKLFSNANVDFNAENRYKNTVLILATLFHRSSQLLESLIRFGADINKRGFSDRTALHSAAEVGNLDSLKYFISKGCDVNAKDEDDSVPLHLAVKYSKVNTHQMVEVLITHGADVNALDNEGDSVLFEAISGGRDESLLRVLIQYGADWNISNLNKETVLHRAAKSGNLSALKLFIELGCDVNSKEKKNSTPLHFAVLFSKPNTLQIVEKLVEHGADINAVDNDGDSVISEAIRGGRDESFLKTMQQFGANWTISNKLEETSLHWAAEAGNLSALKLFLSLSCYDINAKNLNGHTPLHTAFQGESTVHDVVTELLKHGADVNATDKDGKLPSELARERVLGGKTEKRTLALLELLPET